MSAQPGNSVSQAFNVQAELHAAVAAHQQGRLDEAERGYRRVLAASPAQSIALSNLGALLEDTQRPAEAEASYRQALAADATNADTHCNLGLLLHNDNRTTEAEAHYRQVIALKPGSALAVLALNKLGLLFQQKEKLPEAEACFREALKTKPDDAEAHANLGVALYSTGNDALMPEAEAHYREALRLKPDYVPTMFNLSLVLLAQGKWKEGWTLHERRFDESRYWGADLVCHERPVSLPFPEWRGESLAGKSLVVWPEQGLGDVVQFARYLPLLKAQGVSTLTVVCPAPLVRLVRSIEGVDVCVPLETGQLPQHDYVCFLLSLPYFFGTTLETVPANVPYISVPDELAAYWKAKLPPDEAVKKSSKKTAGKRSVSVASVSKQVQASKKLRVGLVWAGDPRPDLPFANATDRRRSMHAKAFLPLLQTPSVTFVSLQKGATTRTQIEDIPQALRPFDPMGEVQDFADTAAIIENLDLVITVDTSVAHVAGALNQPVWILSRFDACWRWLTKREDSPWYPSARIFRQQKPGDWTGLLEKVQRELEKIVQGGSIHASAVVASASVMHTPD